jgi:hypothetical protein
MALPPPPRTPALRAAAAVAAAEGIGFAGYALLVAIEVARTGLSGPTEISNVPAVVLEIAIFALFGVALLAAGHGLWRARRWARSPFLLAQVLGLVVGIPLAQADEAGPRVAGIALAVLCLVGLVLSFAPGVTAELEGGRDPSG